MSFCDYLLRFPSRMVLCWRLSKFRVSEGYTVIYDPGAFVSIEFDMPAEDK